MSIHRFINQHDPEKPFHSSGYARTAHGDRIGSASTQSFSERARVERSRQAVRKYHDSHVARGHGQQTYRYAPIDIVKPSRPDGSRSVRPSSTAATPDVPVAPRPTFQEPSATRYNPYA